MRAKYMCQLWIKKGEKKNPFRFRYRKVSFLNIALKADGNQFKAFLDSALLSISALAPKNDLRPSHIKFLSFSQGKLMTAEFYTAFDFA